MEKMTIVVMEGDQTGQELLEESLRVLSSDALGLPIEFKRFDLSLDNRRKTENQVVYDAAAAMRDHRYGLKAATITPEQSGDVGSPNAILRKEINGTVIVRTGRRIPGIAPPVGVFSPISVVRMAVDGAYGAEEWRETSERGSSDEVAYRTERISRTVCHGVAEYAFQHAKRLSAKVFGGPKFTVSPVYEGMFKEELDAASKRHTDVAYEPQLIDATYALLLVKAGEPLVIPALNRDGDCLSDLVLQMFGSIAGSESILLSLDEDWMPKVVMAEAPHGTAPSLFGKNLANPMAMILAGASLLAHHNDEQAQRASRIIYEATLEAVVYGVRTTDLGGGSNTTEFTDDVIQRVKNKMEIQSTLGH
ncbi:isocitrate/isopropylmalate family dehydrogenase [Alicyclobacillus sp. SO9]|uniref:isocitrate/isopropylmalate family dehydrogenase n=1 Tax=Alicyclobacillus sp. SO9 TaxID=2665646 RepID=UPI0018E718CE|nr:isocitrate/isopropylmalate family dehydrogenase [Alicyclobacillus sp. SO9]QQE79605.1 isocitrate dehydrogenase [Alicyclobacillus sp. SO9]